MCSNNSHRLHQTNFQLYKDTEKVIDDLQILLPQLLPNKISQQDVNHCFPRKQPKFKYNSLF